MTPAIDTPHSATPPRAPATRPAASFARTLVSLCLAGVLVVSQLYTVIPILGDLARSWSTSAAGAGWTATAFGLGYAAGFLLFGPLADRFDHRRFLVLGLAATAVATAAVAFAPSLAVGCALRVVQGLFAATFAPTAFAYVARHVEPARRIAATTWLTTFFISSAVIGQVLAQLTAALGGWRAVFVASAVALAGCAALLAVVLRSDTAGARSSTLAAYRAMGRQLTRPVVWLLLGATVTVLGSFVSIYAALQLSGPTELAGRPDALLALRASALPAMLAVPLATPLLVRLPAARRVGAALLLAAVGAALIAVVASAGGAGPVLLAVLLLPIAFAVAVAAPGLVEAIGTQAGEARGAAVALYTFVLFVGASCGPLLAGALAGVSWFGGGFAGVLACLALLLTAGAASAAAAHRTAARPPGQRPR